MKVSTRKVNKPRLTLRKNTGRVLSQTYRGVVPMLLRFGAPIEALMPYPPERVLEMIALFMNQSEPSETLVEADKRQLREYLKRHNIEDWTRRADGEGTDSRTPRASEGVKGKGRKRLGDVRLPVRSVGAQERD